MGGKLIVRIHADPIHFQEHPDLLVELDEKGNPVGSTAVEPIPEEPEFEFVFISRRGSRKVEVKKLTAEERIKLRGEFPDLRVRRSSF